MVSLAVASSAAGISASGVTLRDGGLYNRSGQILAAAGADPVVAMTVSPGGRYVVFVRRHDGELASRVQALSMWIHDRRTGKRKQVGRGLGYPCCELATESIEPSRVFGKFERVNGAFWSDSQRLLVRFVNEVHVLSMDGSLRGDV
jgi:hypothetical protein